MIKVTVTVPKEVLNIQSVRAEILRALGKTGDALEMMFERTTETWDTQVQFESRVENSPSELSVRVWTTNPIYSLVNSGSFPHTIRARSNRLLRFQTGYRPKTRPRVMRSHSGGKFGEWAGGSMGGVRSVNHPGFEPREFDETAARHVKVFFEERIQEAIARGSK